jgi:hypothetical protein
MTNLQAAQPKTQVVSFIRSFLASVSTERIHPEYPIAKTTNQKILMLSKVEILPEWPSKLNYQSAKDIAQDLVIKEATLLKSMEQVI